MKSLVSDETSISIQMIPNPARDEAILLHEVPENSRAELVFMDAVGRPVQKFAVQGGVGKTTFSVSSLANGYYRFMLIDEKGVIGQGQLTIMR